MKKLITLLVFALTVIHCNAQQQFNFSYKLKHRVTKHGSLYQVDHKKFTKVSLKEFKKDHFSKIGGTITFNKTHDTLFLTPWYYNSADTSRLNSNGKGLPLDQNSQYAFVPTVGQWEGGYPRIRIPFTYRQLTATNLSIRIDQKGDGIQTNFLSANMAYFWVRGWTTFYKSKFVDPRNFCIGFGPFVGVGTVQQGAISSTPIFGLNYGINGMVSFYNFNLIPAWGFENTFQTPTSKKSFSAYFGIGFGIKILNLYTPVN